MCIHIPIYGIIKKHYFYYAVQKGRRILSGNKLNYIQDEGDWMKKVRVYHYDAFSVISNKGNPAGVVLHADGLCAEDMQQIARQVGFNETSFVLKSDVASFRFRYFTPGHEMDLCGHATVATVFCLKRQGLLPEVEELSVETKAGILKIRVSDTEQGFFIHMQQAEPKFIPYEGSIDALAGLMGLTADHIDPAYPVVYGSTGIWTLLVPIRSLETFNMIKPDNVRFRQVLIQKQSVSLHPFCLHTYDPKADLHARHFSSPQSGIVEDAVTGTAAGVLGAYYQTFLQSHQEEVRLIVEQGQEMNREGRVYVYVRKEQGHLHVEISGTAVYVKEFMLEYEEYSF